MIFSNGTKTLMLMTSTVAWSRRVLDVNFTQSYSVFLVSPSDYLIFYNYNIRIPVITLFKTFSYSLIYDNHTSGRRVSQNLETCNFSFGQICIY